MKTYIVQPGDTLGKIAVKFYGQAAKYQEIAQANNIDNPNQIRVGQSLKLPAIEEDARVEPPAKPTATGVVLDKAQLKAIMPNATDANLDRYLAPLNQQMIKWAVDTPLRVAHCIAQLAHESGSFKYTEENLNYSAKALRSVFGKYFPTAVMAEASARQPEKIANVVYADRMGNKDTASGDGWRYRGRGLIQLTGHDNYAACGKGMKLDLLDHPEPLATDPVVAVGGALWYWDSRDLNKYADQDDIETITKRINGGLNGLEDRKKYLERAKSVLIFDNA